jgi:hypothetical protein
MGFAQLSCSAVMLSRAGTTLHKHEGRKSFQGAWLMGAQVVSQPMAFLLDRHWKKYHLAIRAGPPPSAWTPRGTAGPTPKPPPPGATFAALRRCPAQCEVSTVANMPTARHGREICTGSVSMGLYTCEGTVRGWLGLAGTMLVQLPHLQSCKGEWNCQSHPRTWRGNT